MMYNVEYCWMVSLLMQAKISFLKQYYLISWIMLQPLWALHLIHCFLNCASLLMSTEIEMIYARIYVTLMYV